MAIIVEKKTLSGVRKRFILIGSGRRPGNFGATEEPFVVVCDDSGTIEIMEDFSDTIKVVKVDGQTPSELCKDQCSWYAEGIFVFYFIDIILA